MDVTATTAPTETPLPPTSGGSGTPTPQTFQTCLDGSQTAAKCLINSKPSYSYTSAFGGRTALGTDVDLPMGNLSASIPIGFYEDKRVKVADIGLIASNIVKGSTVFGVTGDLEDTSLNTCNSGNLANGTQNPATCLLTTASKYAYQDPYGGRSNMCSMSSGTDGQSIQGRCWFALGNRYFYSSQIEFPGCDVNSRSTQKCEVTPGKFLYTNAFGGRIQTCSYDTLLSDRCWVKDPNKKVFNIVYCNEDPAVNSGFNAAACFPTKVGNWVYTAPFGGRDRNCEDNINGHCYFDKSTKDQSSGYLTAANIKSGEKIFGIFGTFLAEGFYWGSGAHRVPGNKRMVYMRPPGPVPTVLPYSAAESALTASEAEPIDYRFIPAFTPTDTSTEALPSVRLVNRTSWGNTQCGQNAGTIDQKIANCTAALGVETTWDGIIKGNAGQGKWQLVSRKNVSGVNYEVWKDGSTELLWSSRVSGNSGLNWCRAAGNSFSNKVDEKYREDDPANICDNSANQNNGNDHPISACVEGLGGYLPDNTSLLNGFLASGTNQDGKAGLKTLPAAQKSQGRVFWRLPSANDFALANHNGMRFVLPDISSGGGYEWTATTFSGDRQQAWVINISNGARKVQSKTTEQGVRCIGR